jgi:DnaJ-domain-containing protein 1
MGWEWKAIGLGVGAAVGGPIGAGIGAAIGHAIDSAADAELTEDDAATVLVGGFLSRFASETGHLNSRERELIANICSEVSEASSFSRDNLLSALSEWATNDELFAQVVQAAQNDEDVRRALLTFGWRVASRDNRVDDLEAGWLASAADAMGGSDEDLYVTMIPYCRAPEDDAAIADARSTLGVHESTAPDEIKKTYRELSRKYHPDSHATANDTLKELAAERFAKIVAAYDILQGQSGHKYWGAATDRKELFLPKSREMVRCLFCEQKCRLPEEDNFTTSRCPKCQALLLFEEELAHTIFSGLEESGESTQTFSGHTGITSQVVKEVLADFSNSRVFLAPSIPDDKLQGAVSAYGCGISPSSVLLLYDDTIWGGAREGVMLTTDSVCSHNIGEDPVRIRYADVKTVSHVESGFLQSAAVVVNGHKTNTNTADDETRVAQTLAHAIRCLTTVD